MSTIFRLSIATAVLLGIIFYVLVQEIEHEISEQQGLGYTPSIITVEELLPLDQDDN